MKSIFLILILVLFPISVYSKDATFSWTANPKEDNVTEYHLHYRTGENNIPPYNGTGLNEGNSPIIIDGNVVQYTVTGLILDVTYHFTLTAHSEISSSLYSVIASVCPDSIPVVNIINLN